MPVSKNIRAARKFAGLTLEDVAKKVGTSKQTIHRYETGDIANIPSDKLEKIARALNVTPASLMGWSNSTPYIYWALCNPAKAR